MKPKQKIKVVWHHIPYPVFKEHKDKYFECPKEFTKVNERTCLHKIYRVEQSCPPRYFRVSDKECVRIITIPPKQPFFKVKCPKGYTNLGELGCRIGKKHEKKYPKLPKIIEHKKFNETVVKIPTPYEEIRCPKGYRKVGDYHCEKTVHCPKGYILEKKGKCSLKKVVCPPGTHKKGNKCFYPNGKECEEDDDDVVRE
jgi:hypothetical protein